MPLIKYRDINFKPQSISLIETINGVINEYTRQGYDLTLRQVYYQLVARAVIPNNERSYKNTGNLINDARIAGLIDWTAISDRTRNVRINSHWNSPASIMSSVVHSYAVDTRDTQNTYVEVWVEKDALISIVEQVSSRWDVPCFSCRGYVSQSEMWAAAQRIQRELSPFDRERAVIIHLGDHDPSGRDMSRDIQDRLDMFDAGGVEVRRIALNWDQIEQYAPPPNPTKLTDSRATAYIDEFGEECWELDALEPRVLTNLIQAEIEDLTDFDALNERKREQEEDRTKLKLVKTNFEKAVSLLHENGIF